MVEASERRAFFKREGYLVVEDLLAPQDVARCQVEIARLHQMAQDLAAAGDPDLRCFQREPFAQGAETDGLPVLRKVEETRRFCEVFLDLARHPGLIRVVQELIGSRELLLRVPGVAGLQGHGSLTLVADAV